MDILFTFLTTSPIGIAIFGCFIVGIIVLVIFLLARGYTIERDEHGKLRFFREQKKSSDNNEKDYFIKQTPEQVSERINDIMDGSLQELLEVKKKFNKEQKIMQENKLARALDVITIKWGEQITEERASEILELYMRRDFYKIMIDTFAEIKQQNESKVRSSDEILGNIPQYSEDIMIKLKKAVDKFDLIIDKGALKTFFEEQRLTIKNTLDGVVNDFVKLSDGEQKAIIEVRRQRIEKINNVLCILLGK